MGDGNSLVDVLKKKLSGSESSVEKARKNQNRPHNEVYNNGRFSIKRCGGNYPYKIISGKTGRVVGSAISKQRALHNVTIRMTAEKRNERIQSKS